MYAAPVLSPIMKCNIQCLERVQCHFMKQLGHLCDTSYHERLISLNASSLEHERIVSDVYLLHKSMYDKLD